MSDIDHKEDEPLELEEAEFDEPVDEEADAPTETDPDAERDLTVIRPAMFRAHPFRFGLIVLVFLAGIVLAVMSKASDSVPESGWVLYPAMLVSAAMLIYWTVWWYQAHLSVKLRVTNKRTIHRKGFLSRNTSEVLHEHIRNIRIDQSFFQRLLSVGRLRIDSSAGGGENVEIEVFDVPRPHELKAMIDPYRKL